MPESNKLGRDIGGVSRHRKDLFWLIPDVDI